eukprot:TCONS_00031626-protein
METSKKYFLPQMETSYAKFNESMSRELKCAFDSTGQFYSCRSETTRDFFEPVKYCVFAYHHNGDTDLQFSKIQMIKEMASEEFSEVYDPHTTRWFLITTNYSPLAEVGMINMLYSGCLRNHFWNSCSIDMTGEENNIFTLRNDILVKNIDTKRIGNKNFLAVLDSDDVIELFSYDEIEVSTFKRIRIGEHAASHLPAFKMQSFFFDLKSEVAYFLYRLNEENTHALNTYPFSGEEWSICHLWEHDADQRCEYDVHHIKDSLFLTVEVKSKKVTIFKVVKNEKILLNEFILNTPGSSYIDYKTMQLFDKFYLHVESTRRRVSQFIDLLSGKKILECWYDYYVQFVGINWNMSEMALMPTEESKWIYGEDDEEDEEEVVFKSIGYHDISLKHFSRLACLKSFGGSYLNQHLPIALTKYLGLFND